MINHVSFPGLGIHNWTISRVAFEIGSFPVYWYGVLIAAAMLICFYLAQRQAHLSIFSKNDVMDAFLVVLPSALIGARLYYVVFEWSRYKNNWFLIFDTRSGGMAFYGGVIGAVIAFIFVFRYKQKSVLAALDFFVVYLPLGQAIGRWGNFVNQEAFGSNTDLPWGMISENTVSYLSSLNPEIFPNIKPSMPVHPTFLYESLANILIFAFLLYRRKHNTGCLQNVAYYFLTYGAVRFIVEGLRTDPLFIASTGIRVSQLLSLIMVLTAVTYLVFIKFQDRRKESVRMS